MSDRWFRLNTTWSQSEWLAALPPASRLAWVELLAYVKAHGMRGRAQEISPRRFADMARLAEADVLAMLFAAVEAAALYSEDGEWVIAEWSELQRGDGALRLNPVEWAVLRAMIFARDNYTCQYCGARGVQLECDHVVPVTRGGGHEPENLRTACLPCNRSKGNKLLSEWRP